MKNSMLIRRPITDGSSEYSVRIPNMTEWEQDEVLATESYVNNYVSNAIAQDTSHTRLYLHSWTYTGSSTTINYNIYWVSDSSTKVQNLIDLYNALSTAISIWTTRSNNRHSIMYVKYTLSILNITVASTRNTDTNAIEGYTVNVFDSNYTKNDPVLL